MSGTRRLVTWPVALAALVVIALPVGMWLWYPTGTYMKIIATLFFAIMLVGGVLMRRSTHIAATFTDAQPGVVREWRTAIDPQMDAYYIKQFLDHGIPLSEVVRVGAYNLTGYRAHLQFEEAAGIRFGDGMFTHPNRKVLTRLRLDNTVKHPSVLRVIAFLACGPERNQSRALPAAADALHDLTELHQDPQDVAGWLLAYHAVIATGMMRKHPDAIRVLAPWRTMPHPRPWLLALAGVKPGEALPAEAGDDGLAVLAALRGYPIDLVRSGS